MDDEDEIDFGEPVAEEPLDLGVPEGFAETGRRSVAMELDPIEIRGDPTGQGRGSDRTLVGQGTELEVREIAPTTYARHRPTGEVHQIFADQPELARERGWEVLGPSWKEAPPQYVPPPGALERLHDWARETFSSPQARVAPEEIQRSQPWREGFDIEASQRSIEQPYETLPGRARAMALGALDASTFGFSDELAGGMRIGGTDYSVPMPGAGTFVRLLSEDPVAAVGRSQQEARDVARQEMREAEEQHPAPFLGGQILGTAPLAAAPAGAVTLPGRMAVAAGQGAVTGGLRGAGEAEELRDVPREALTGGAVEGLLSAGTVGLTEGPLDALAGWARRRAAAAPEHLVRAELAARGITSARDLDAASRFRGGREGLVEELNRMDVPLRPDQVPQWAQEQLGTIGPRVSATADALTERGAAVDMGRLAGGVDDLARSVETRAGGRQIAQALRSDVADQWRRQALLPGRGAEGPAGPPVPFSQAWEERMHLDDLAGDLPAQGLGRVSGRLAQSRRMLNEEMTDQALQTDPALALEWQQANRDYSVPAFLSTFGQQADRLNQQGGISGALSRAQGAAQLLYGNPLGAVEAVGGPMVQQEIRMMLPGLQARHLRRVVAGLQARGGPRSVRWLQMLQQAESRGPVAAAAVHSMLSRTDPEYRSAVQALEEDEEQE